MTLTVKLFGSLAQKIGKPTIDIDLTDGATGADLLAVLSKQYPSAAGVLSRASFAVNLRVSPWTTRVTPSDEVAILPPASGGSGVSVGLGGDMSVDEAVAAASADGAGGLVVFVGTVRDHSDAGDVNRLEYSAYDAMADRVLREIADEAVEKWGLRGVAVRHAVGVRRVGATTIVVACSAPHRNEAFDACQYVVDELKQRAPIWKKEFGSWGERWI
jgi:molybdopterin synthase catalytic subunit/molybdopterin converting factor small subunit